MVAGLIVPAPRPGNPLDYLNSVVSSAAASELGAGSLAGNLGAVERGHRSVDEVAADANESVAMPDADVVGLAGDAVLFEQGLEVAGLGAVAFADVDEDLANR